MDGNNLYLESLKARNEEMFKYFQIGVEIIERLKEKTYEAYIVGGAVRDLILNIDFNDIDIATNATPDAIKEIFSDCNLDDTYEQFGAIVLKAGGFRYEITTFRMEGYAKFKIKDVHYSKKLVEDVIRRDYTINALALTPNLTIVDIVDGQKDLENGIVRIIGSGKRRFKEDPSRILRGLLLVAKYNFRLELNTEKGMRKSKTFLKEVSEYKLINLMKRLLEEKYALKALKIIDDDRLFKFIPLFDEWVRLIIKNYRKLNLNEKMTLLYRIMGKIPENTGHTHEELAEIKKLLELSQNISVNKVNKIMVFKVGTTDLLAADRISKALGHRYKKQKHLIKKIDKKLQIHNANELEITRREIMELANYDEEKITRIMKRLVVMVVNDEVHNDTKSLKDEVYKMISNATSANAITNSNDKKSLGNLFRHHKENDEQDFNDESEETKLYKKFYDDYQEETVTNFDAWDQISYDDYDDENKESNAQNNEISDNAINALKEEYREDFMHLYQIYLKGIKDYYNLPEREQRVRSAEIKLQVKEFLLRTNEKYRILHEKGLI